MKKVFLLILILAGLSVLSACTDDYTEKPKNEKSFVPNEGITAIKKDSVVIPPNG